MDASLINLFREHVNDNDLKVFRRRVKACEELRGHIGLPDESAYLWRTVIAFQDYPFATSGRGKDHTGATKFKYTVSKEGKAGGRHYAGEEIPGYGNEMWVIKDGQRAGKSISRSTVDLAFQNALEVQEKEGYVSGPRKLGVPGARSTLYVLFIRFGVITDTM